MLAGERTTRAAIAITGTLVLGGCAATPLTLSPDGGAVTGSIAEGKAGSRATDSSNDTARSGQRIAKDAPRRSADRLAAARGFRDKGDRPRALVELERGLAEHPGDRDLAREAGLVALELGHTDKARTSLELAIDPKQPDWQSISALGTALAASGKQSQAQTQFKKALALKPGHRPTLNNLALSYALDGKLAEAEKTLKAAGVSEAASPRQMKENMALVMALAGKYDDAEKLAAAVLPKAKAQANMVYVRSLTQQGG